MWSIIKTSYAHSMARTKWGEKIVRKNELNNKKKCTNHSCGLHSINQNIIGPFKWHFICSMLSSSTNIYHIVLNILFTASRSSASTNAKWFTDLCAFLLFLYSMVYFSCRLSAFVHQSHGRARDRAFESLQPTAKQPTFKVTQTGCAHSINHLEKAFSLPAVVSIHTTEIQIAVAHLPRALTFGACTRTHSLTSSPVCVCVFLFVEPLYLQTPPKHGYRIDKEHTEPATIPVIGVIILRTLDHTS